MCMFDFDQNLTVVYEGHTTLNKIIRKLKFLQNEAFVCGIVVE